MRTNINIPLLMITMAILLALSSAVKASDATMSSEATATPDAMAGEVDRLKSQIDVLEAGDKQILDRLLSIRQAMHVGPDEAQRPKRTTQPLLPVAVVEPPHTAVLILPPIDVTTWAPRMHPLHETSLTHRIEYEFITRQFKVLGPDMAAAAARAINFDVRSANARTSDSLAALGKQANADWVVNIELDDLRSDSTPPRSRWKMSATTTVQIYDVKRHGWIADNDFDGLFDAGAQAAGPMMMNDGAINTSGKVACGSILSAYKQVISVGGEATSFNYLWGQTEPFTGDPNVVFSGLPHPKGPIVPY